MLIDLQPAESAIMRGFSLAQTVTLGLLIAVPAFCLWKLPGEFGRALVFLAAAAFMANAFWRTILVFLADHPLPAPASPPEWPRYTVVAALHDEAEILPQLVRRLAATNYPPDRLEGFLVLEADDAATLAAADRLNLPSWLSVLVVPEGQPRTKPRALNHALSIATGELLTVYDAEDAPDPGQLREAASRFSVDAEDRLACLQAPLRVRIPASGSRTPFLDRQFAAEYASLFEVVLPGMARLGLPFPLGGTSNHFRTEVLRAVGGWDPWNVTEDADLGFRLWKHGWQTGVIARPTWEPPPGDLAHWLPQRTRWLKGHMQTWGVHTRRPWELEWRGGFALVSTIGVGLASAAVHAATSAWISATVLVALMAGLTPATPFGAMAVLLVGASSAWLSCRVGARRAGIRYSLRDIAQSPLYWSLLSMAFVHAFWRLIREPFAWDKTSHRSDPLDEAAPDGLSAPHAAAPEPVS